MAGFGYWGIVDNDTKSILEIFEGTWEEVKAYSRICFDTDTVHIVVY